MTGKVLALEVAGLRKSFGPVVAANNIHVQIEAGTVLSIIGTNGAGKTSFINMVTGYLRPDDGRIKFYGHDITGRSPREITALGLGRSFQIPQLFDGMSVVENLLAAASISGLNRINLFESASQRDAVILCENLLRRFALDRVRHERPENLAGGTRKLLDIAMAVVSHPKMLLLDEPTSGVSSDEKMGLMQQVLAATEESELTAVLVEHDIDIVERFSHRVLAFFAGEIIADGPPQQVLSDMRVRDLITGA